MPRIESRHSDFDSETTVVTIVPTVALAVMFYIPAAKRGRIVKAFWNRKGETGQWKARERCPGIGRGRMLRVSSVPTIESSGSNLNRKYISCYPLPID